MIHLLPNGKYRTLAGSTVTISGNHAGVATVEFDWLDEDQACIDCHPEPYPEYWGHAEWRLVWHCAVCGGGSAKLDEVAR